MTTFARIAKILKGLVEPRNWVEEAFAESGGGGAMVVHVDENGVLDKTWVELRDAELAILNVQRYGGTSTIWDKNSLSLVVYQPDAPDEQRYSVYFGQDKFGTKTEDGYPGYLG